MFLFTQFATVLLFLLFFHFSRDNSSYYFFVAFHFVVIRFVYNVIKHMPLQLGVGGVGSGPLREILSRTVMQTLCWCSWSPPYTTTNHVKTITNTWEL